MSASHLLPSRTDIRSFFPTYDGIFEDAVADGWLPDESKSWTTAIWCSKSYVSITLLMVGRRLIWKPP